MKKLSIVLVCGSGASTGFMAANIRKAASKKGIECTVIAKSEAEIETILDGVDCLMVGPHLKFQMEEMEEKAKAVSPDIKVVLMKKSYYSLLDGSAALDHALSVIGEE